MVAIYHAKAIFFIYDGEDSPFVPLLIMLTHLSGATCAPAVHHHVIGGDMESAAIDKFLCGDRWR
jgi:hypothetical protein